MIPFDHWHDNGDGTAWLVKSGFDSDFPASRLSELDRPCDTCSQYSGPNDVINRKDCIDGRHTFEVEVEHHDAAYMTYQTSEPSTRTYRVSIVPGMVLPILSLDPHRWPGVALPPAARPGMWAVKVRVEP